MEKKYTLFFVTFILFIFTLKSFAQVDISGTPYTTLKGAFDAINAGTHTGAITVNVNANTTETASAVLNSSGTGSASYTSVLIKPTTTGLTISGNIAGALINLNGADGVTIDGRVGVTSSRELTLNNTNTATLSAVVRLSSAGTGLGASRNTVQWCTIQGGVNTVSLSVYGIYVAGATISATGTVADNDTLSFTDNLIKKVSTGIYSRGTSTGNPNDNMVIQNNIIGADAAADYVTLNGVDMTNSTNVTISNNQIYNIIADHSVQLRGLFLSAGMSNITVNANLIYNIQNTTTTTFRGGQAIYISGTGTVNATISNNAIWGLQGHGSGTATNNAWGILVNAGNGYNIYYNTISMNLNGTATGSTDRSGCVYFVSAASTTINMMNNNFY
ncbi:MAG: hypothetical protein J0M18_11485, partial [Ignavibacteria bacterium]|nr:hypothetical protein [Ignavibacteria bacterium]